MGIEYATFENSEALCRPYEPQNKRQRSNARTINMSDTTEAVRLQELTDINTNPGSREALEATHGQVWDDTGVTE